MTDKVRVKNGVSLAFKSNAILHVKFVQVENFISLYFQTKQVQNFKI